MMRWKMPLVAVLGAVMSLLVAGTAHAAVGARAVHGNDWGEIRSVGSGSYNDYIIVCDGEADGHYVWAQYHLVSVFGGVSEYRSVYDFDGPNNNSCGIHDYRGTPYFARAIRVCEYEGGCSAWAYTGDPVLAVARTAKGVTP